MRLVTDPAILEQLNADGTAPRGKPVTDPELLKQLNAGDAGTNTAPYEGWGDYLKDLGRTALQGATLNTSDEIIAGIRALTSGQTYDEAAAEERGSLKRFNEQSPGTALVAQLGGGFAVPGAGALATVMRAPSLAGRVVRGTGVGTGIGAAAGFGAGEGSANERLNAAEGGAMGGAVIGAAIPAAGAALSPLGRAIYDKLSPQFARMSAQAKAKLREYGIDASADGGVPPNVGAEAHAEQMVANQMIRAGRTAPGLQAQLEAAEKSSLFHGGGARGDPGASYAANVIAPVDLDPALARLAGSAVRASPEASNTAQRFIQARQTGISPSEGPLPVSTGLPTRAAMSEPITGSQAERQYGTSYGTAQNRLVPMGQNERVVDALKRALQIKDEKFHGHGANAYQTEQQIIATAREEAKQFYSDAYAAGRNIDLRPQIAPILQKWANAASDEPLPVQKQVQKAIELFTSGKGNVVNTLERFDKSKQFLDGEIERFFESVEGRNRYVGSVLSAMKNELLEAVDSIQTSDLGGLYSKARGAFGSQMEARDMLRLGGEILNENSNVAVDAFRAVGSEGHKKLVRLGLLQDVEYRIKNKVFNNDVIQLFNTPRVQEILREIIPENPERFGQYLGNERLMIGTRNEVLGNSKTAQRLADDAAYEQSGIIADAVTKLKNSGSLAGVSIEVVQGAFNKLFGMPADSAAALTRMLFTANPQQQAAILARVQQRMGPGRFDQLTRLMQQLSESATPVGANYIGAAAGG